MVKRVGVKMQSEAGATKFRGFGMPGVWVFPGVR